MKIKSFTTPKNNKEIFIKPVYEDIPGLVDLNKERFQSYGFEINGIPFSRFRKQARSETLKTAGEYTEKIQSLCSKLNITGTETIPSVNSSFSSEKVIIQTGHSPTLVHPGILIKHNLATRISNKLNGIGINMIVDNDACHDNCLNIPNINGLDSYIKRIGYLTSLHNLAFEEIRYGDRKQLTTFKENVLKTLHNPEMKETFNDFINIVIKLSEEALQFSDLFTYARYAFLLRFGISNLEVPVSAISETDSFLHFFLHITANAKSFVDIYNTKLREYRKLKRISSKANPLPDLMVRGNIIEMPFWIWEGSRQRKSLYTSVASDGCISVISEDRIVEHFEFDSSNSLSDNNLKRLRSMINKGLKIRPKAITNTMFSRLFFSDLFIHGIGGAKYDLITDEIIRDFFDVEPPTYATISATLHLPYKPLDVSKEDIKTLKHVIKDMGYNPDRYASDEIMEDAGMKPMVRKKKELIARKISDGNERHVVFGRLKHLNSLMKEKISPLIKEKEKKLEDLEKKLKYNSIVANREYPFCVYPEVMLAEMFGLKI